MSSTSDNAFDTSAIRRRRHALLEVLTALSPFALSHSLITETHDPKTLSSERRRRREHTISERVASKGRNEDRFGTTAIITTKRTYQHRLPDASHFAEQMASLPQWTYEEIAKHNKATDCWVVIDDNVYDVTQFVPRHPGGNMIYLNAGRESTRLFESYHKRSVKSLLAKYQIGTVKDTNLFRIQFADDEKDRAIFDRIKQRVMLHFKNKKIHPRFSMVMYVKTVLILTTYVLAYYLAHFYFHNFWLSALSAVMMGFLTAEVGVSIQHDANHGAYHSNPSVNKWVGTTLDLFGASSFIWKQQHVFGHHVYTNIDGIDPDIRIKDPDFRRITRSQPWHRYQRYQHLYLGFLYGLLAIKSIFVDDFTMLATGVIDAIPVNHIHLEEKIVFFGGKIIFACHFILLPLLYSHYSLTALLKLWLISQLVTGWTLAFMFQVNHVTEGVDFYEKTEDRLSVGWTRSQIEGTSDFAHGSWFWTHISGGLNYQVVHHLFPWICHVHYPEIAPIIKDVCREEGIKYVAYPTFLAAVRAHFDLMKTIGMGTKLN